MTTHDTNWLAYEWQPIETAPKDCRILIFSCQGEAFAAHWAKHPVTDHEAWIIAEWGDDGDQALIENPTHWMPLPKPPRKEGEQ